MRCLLALAFCFVFVSLVAGHGYSRVRTVKTKTVIVPKPVYQPKTVIHPKPVVHKPIIHQKPVIKPVVHPKPVFGKPVVHPKPVFGKPVVHPKPVYEKPVVHPKPVYEKPVVHPKPIFGNPVVHPKSVYEKPVVHPKPVIGNPVVHPKPVIGNPVVHPKPVIGNPVVHPKPVIGNPGVHPLPVVDQIGVQNFGDDGFLPPEIAAIIGSTVNGELLRGGEGGLPIHGGFGQELPPEVGPNVAGIPPVSNFGDPWNNAASPVNIHAEHQIVKEADHAARKTIGGVSPVAGPFVDPVNHHVEKQIVGQQVHNVGKIQNHNIVKSSGVIAAGKPSYLSTRPINPSLVGHGASVIGHNVGHNIAKSAASPVGVGFINPNGHVANKVGHNIAKSTAGGALGAPIGGGYIGVSQLQGMHGGIVGTNPVVHNAVKATGGVGVINHLPAVNPVHHPAAKVEHNIVKSSIGGARPVGGAFGQFHENPVHQVHKVAKSGIVAAGHDPLAVRIGHGIAKQVMEDSATVVDIGSDGGVSAGNPLALAASKGLAHESMHVAGKTLHAASQSNPILPGGPIGVGKNIFGGVHPKPVIKTPTRRFPRRRGGY